MSASGVYRLYSAPGSGAVAVEAALTLLGLHYERVEGATWADEHARERVAPVNAMRQVPTLVYPDGEVMTESAAILLHLADAHPQAGLAPPAGHALRRTYLRWMVYVSSAIYALHWIKPDVRRIGAPPASRDDVVHAVHERIAFCWAHMDEQLCGHLAPAPYLLGGSISMLDLYVNVVSRFGPWRERFAQAAPRMAESVQLVDRDPRLVALWRSRFEGY